MNSPQQILFSNDIPASLDALLSDMEPAGVFVVTDTNVERIVLPGLGLDCPVIAIPPGDSHKDLSSLSAVWERLVELGANRRSVILNIGGGVVTDLGGFAAASFKRGVRFVNVPTTLLSAVDAAVGGKTGINFCGLKNEVGAFAPADGVVISASTFSTLPPAEMLSGYAEMIKHALLSSAEDYAGILAFSPLEGDEDRLLGLLSSSVNVKRRIVAEDPSERGLRRALNLGHTVGHAFESLALAGRSPLPHGHAVAAGLVAELVMSHLHKGFPTSLIYPLRDFIKDNGYMLPAFTCEDYPRLLALMSHDKKNEKAGSINFTLLSAPGEVSIDCNFGPDEVSPALDIYRDLME